MGFISNILINKEYNSIVFFFIVYLIQYINICFLKKNFKIKNIEYDFTIKYQLRLPIAVSLVYYYIICVILTNKEKVNTNIISDVDESNNIYTEQPNF